MASTSTSGMAANVCGAHPNGGACSLCVHQNFESQEMFKKILSYGDIVDGSFCIPTSHDAARFGLVDGDELTVYDVQMNNTWTMKLLQDVGKDYLGGSGWLEFVIEKGLREADTVTFYELIRRLRGIGPTLFQIGVDRKGCVQLFGVILATN